MEVPQEAKGLFASLFDFSFTSFVTAKLIKVLYALGIVIGAIVGLFALVSAMGQGALAGLGALILVPLVFLLWVMYLRVVLEVLVVVFRIAENTAEIARHGQTP